MHLRSAIVGAVLLTALTAAVLTPPSGSQTVNWNVVTAVSKSTPTLQAVINPLLNAATSEPVASAAWATLKSLNASHARFAAWFPYPQWGVAELYPPFFSDSNSSSCTTSWNFTGLLTQLEPFLSSVQSAVLDVSTLPQWLFSQTGGFSGDPASNQADWGYTTSGTWLPNSTQQAAEYYGRLAAYLLNGKMVDECGRLHVRPEGPVVARRAGFIWEIFNEPEYEMRGCGPERYVATFDAIVAAVRESSDPQHQVQFQGLALQYHGEWNWWNAFLNPMNHVPEVRDAVNVASFHFYSVLRHRVDNSTWEWELFDPVEDFYQECQEIVRLRDSLSPQTRLNADECGSILPQDNDPLSPPPSDLYFVGSAALYAYLFARLSVVGVDIIGESQLAGTPPQPRFNIVDAQYPSVSMLNWSTGEGNARFHVLKLIKELFSPGDTIHDVSLPARVALCGAVWNNNQLGLNYDKAVNLSCPKGSNVSEIFLAHAGHILGDCDSGFETTTASCTDKNQSVLEYVRAICVGKESCAISMTAMEPLAPHCFAEGPVRLIVSAQCSGGMKGTAVPSGYVDDRVFIQARSGGGAGKKSKMLLAVNRNNKPATMKVSALLDGAVAYVIDRNDASPTVLRNLSGYELLLAPFATVIVSW
jgi:hypothetical protein